MLSRVLRNTSLLATVAAMAIGCAGGTVTPGQTQSGPQAPSNDTLGTPHLMLTRSTSRHVAPDTGAQPNITAKLVYNGGPVLQNVKVVTVFWGNNVQFSGTGTQSLNAFYKAVTASSYYDWLSEYNTSSPAQKIGEGTLGGSYAYTAGKTGSIKDSDISSALGTLIDGGKLPAPDANTLYAVHFAPGISITMSDGSASCVVFCAYHNSFSHNGKNVYYSVVPDQGGSCAGGCGSDPSLFNNTTSVSSHELVEATTDADVGQNNLAWYDQTNGEIGDICNASQGTICGYTVQTEWSNQSNACIVKKASGDGSCGGGTTCTPQCTGKVCGDDGCGGSCGTCPSGQSCNASGQCQSSCTPSCGSKQCGDDGCGGSCGTCPSGSTCDSSGMCQSSCVPSCGTNVCGSDGCGGSCGTCGAGTTCSGGQCVPSGGGTCSHDLCTSGGPLVSGCDPCVTSICKQDSYCCNYGWDSICEGEVSSICGSSQCSSGGGGGGGGGGCSHSTCSTGSALSNGCDSCVSTVCGSDGYCCSVKWDKYCVSESKSWCGGCFN